MLIPLDFSCALCYNVFGKIKFFGGVMKELGKLINSFRAKELTFKQFTVELGCWFDDIGIGKPFTEAIESSWFPYVAIALGALVLFYGTKWIGFMRFLSCAAIGFVTGLVLNPMLVETETLPFLEGKAWITGALCALILAVLGKLIFGLIFFGGPAAGAFAAFYLPDIIPGDLPTVNNLYACLGIAAGAALLMLMIRKNFQRILTSGIGGVLVTVGVKKLYDYTALLPEYALYIDIGAFALLVLLGFTYQYRRRRRY